MTDARDDAVWHDVTEDYFRAIPVDGGVAVSMTPNVASTLHYHADRLVRFLGREDADERALTRMFPDVSADRAAAARFRRYHGTRLRDSAAPRRVRDQLATAMPDPVLSPQEVDDWLVTFALARFVSPPGRWRRSRGKIDLTGLWLNFVQESLILASFPELAGYDFLL